MAPPITVDIMAFTPLPEKYRARQTATSRNKKRVAGAAFASHAAI
jgi:hypothetical protein